MLQVATGMQHSLSVVAHSTPELCVEQRAAEFHELTAITYFEFAQLAPTGPKADGACAGS